jgi:hypothetical protein
MRSPCSWKSGKEFEWRCRNSSRGGAESWKAKRVKKGKNGRREAVFFGFLDFGESFFKGFFWGGWDKGVI